MKIGAIRVRDVGHFATPMALNGLSGGLDVLAAGNEAGKSTLFRALEVAFYEKHTATGDRVQGVTPRGGGSPLIEVDFSANGDDWRITKQFGRGKRSLLAQRNGSGRELRGADADDALARLVGLPDAARGYLPGRLGFLWVGQGGALKVEAPDAKRGEAAALQRIVEREVSELTGGSLVRQLRAEIAEDLGVLKTPSRAGPKARGPWDIAVRRVAEIELALGAAKAARQVAAQRRDALAALKARRLELEAPERVVAARQALADAIAQRDGAIGARRLLVDAQAHAVAQETALREAARTAAALHEQMGDAEAAETVVATVAPRLSAAESALGQRRAALTEVVAEGEELRSDEARAVAAVKAAEQAVLAAQAHVRLAKMRATLEAARTLDREIAEGIAAERGPRIDAVEMDRLADAQAAYQRACDALAAGAPRITIAYEPGVANAIVRDGVALPAGVVADADGIVRLVIAGVGVIEIVAAATADRAEHLAVRDRARVLLDAGFAALGLRDLGEAQAHYRCGIASAAALETLRARLSGVAPAGVGALAADVAAAEANVAELVAKSEGAVELTSAVAALETVRTTLGALRSNWQSLQDEIVQLVGAVEKDRAALEAAQRRIAGLSDVLPAASERGAVLARLQAEAARLQVNASGALRELAAVRQTVPDDAAVERLEARVGLLQAEQVLVANELQQIEVSCAGLEGEEKQADQDGQAGRVPELEGALLRAHGDVARCVADVDALTLLAETVDAAENDNLDRFLTPVVRSLNPLLDLVFPGARLQLAGDFFDRRDRADGRARSSRPVERGDARTVGGARSFGVCGVAGGCGTRRAADFGRCAGLHRRRSASACFRSAGGWRAAASGSCSNVSQGGVRCAGGQSCGASSLERRAVRQGRVGACRCGHDIWNSGERSA